MPAEARAAMSCLKLLVPRLTEEAVNAICYPSKIVDSDGMEPGGLSYRYLSHLLEIAHDPVSIAVQIC